MSEIVLVPVSIGELFDKYTILQIKLEMIHDNEKQINIKKEIEYLQPFIYKYKIDEVFINELKEINKRLWNIEDKIRDKERHKEFDNEFIELARSVYIINDKRSEAKNKINTILNSCLTDIKSYAKY